MKNIKQIFTNATSIKAHNKRTTVIKQSKTLKVDLRILDGDLEPRSAHEVIKNKVVLTHFNLSYEGAYHLYLCLRDQIERNYEEIKREVDL